MQSGIYLITISRPGKLPCYYVGQSKNLKRRLRHHRYQLKAGTHHNAKMQNCWGKYGDSAFLYEILEFCAEDELDALEGWWLTEMFGNRRVLNLGSQPGGGFNRGVKFSDAHKKKIGDGNRGEKHYLKLRPMTDQHRANLSEASLGRPKSIETRAKISSGQRGEKNHHFGKTGANSKTSIRVIGICETSGNTITLDSMTSGVAFGFNASKISECCNGNRPRHKGYKWFIAPLVNP